jgi:Flp pilus assembly protein TadD
VSCLIPRIAAGPFRPGRLAALILAATACDGGLEPSQTGSAIPRYVGSAVCAECHTEQAGAWSDSLHAWAMKPADPDTVSASFTGGPVASGEGFVGEPQRDGDRLVVDVVREDAGRDRHVLRYLLGHRPIEQHLVERPGGRWQPLPIGFDTGRREWFDIFQDDPRGPRDWGFWANRGATSNSQCLYCHTTGYEKGYDTDTDTYRSRWAETGVGCEACHGPGEAHVQARRRGTEGEPYTPPTDARRVDVCATCHALRREIAPGFLPGAHFLDFFEPILLDGDEYYADGQIHQESYEWASFLQSRKHQVGITCTDCHDVHSTGLHASGNELCRRCHDASLAAPEHTHHAPGSPGAECAACHMPVTVYMARDPRRDHSFLLPDPAATDELGVPNPCARCHAERDSAWLAGRVSEWYGESERRAARRRLARMLTRGRRGDPASVPALLDCVRDCPDSVWRASAARLLARFGDAEGVAATLETAAASQDALLRLGASWALSELTSNRPETRQALVRNAADSLRAVRLNAAWGLRTLDATSLTGPDERAAVDGAIREWLESKATEAEHPEAQQTLGVFHAARGDAVRAEASYRKALELMPDALPPRYNLAMLLATGGRRADAETELLQVRRLHPTFAPAAFALGMLYGEEGRWPEAIESLEVCLRLDPLYPGALRDLAHAYVQAGRIEVANRVLEAAVRYPGARIEALRALVTVNLATGDRETARQWARRAAAEDPDLAADARVRELLSE